MYGDPRWSQEMSKITEIYIDFTNNYREYNALPKGRIIITSKFIYLFNRGQRLSYIVYGRLVGRYLYSLSTFQILTGYIESFREVNEIWHVAE